MIRAFGRGLKGMYRDVHVKKERGNYAVLQDIHLFLDQPIGVNYFCGVCRLFGMQPQRPVGLLRLLPP